MKRDSHRQSSASPQHHVQAQFLDRVQALVQHDTQCVMITYKLHAHPAQAGSDHTLCRPTDTRSYCRDI